MARQLFFTCFVPFSCMFFFSIPFCVVVPLLSLLDPGSSWDFMPMIRGEMQQPHTQSSLQPPPAQNAVPADTATSATHAAPPDVSTPAAQNSAAQNPPAGPGTNTAKAKVKPKVKPKAKPKAKPKPSPAADFDRVPLFSVGQGIDMLADRDGAFHLNLFEARYLRMAKVRGSHGQGERLACKLREPPPPPRSPTLPLPQPAHSLTHLTDRSSPAAPATPPRGWRRFQLIEKGDRTFGFVHGELGVEGGVGHVAEVGNAPQKPASLVVPPPAQLPVAGLGVGRRLSCSATETRVKLESLAVKLARSEARSRTQLQLSGEGPPFNFKLAACFKCAARVTGCEWHSD
jgi:hypothetical protein